MMRSCIMLSQLVFMVVLYAVLPVSALAGERESGPPVGRYDSGKLSQDWNAQFSFGYLPAADIHGGAADAGISDYRLKIDRSIKIDDLTLVLGGGYGLKHIDTSPAAALPRDLHALFIEAGVNYRINNRAFASLRLYPGLYGDFEELDSNTVRMPVLALGGYSFENGWSVAGGFIYRFGYHAARFIPALGFSYQPNEQWRFDLAAPRPGITYSPSRKLQLFVAGDFASDEYQLGDRALAAKAIKYSDYKAMVGVSYLPVSTVKLSTSFGYAFERKFAFYEGNRSDLRVDDVPFVRVSLDVGW